MFFFSYTYLIVFLGTFIIGVTAGMVGVYLYFRRESLVADVLGHSTLFGVVLIFILTLTLSTKVLLIGGVVSGMLAFFTYRLIYNNSRLSQDAVLGSVLAYFSGLGITLITYVQKFPQSSEIGLWNYIFGNASSLLKSDVILSSVNALIILSLIIIFYKELKLITFDSLLAKTLALPIKKFDALIILMTGTTIIVGIQSVGIILISSLLITPVATLSPWLKQLKRFSTLLVGSGLLGGLYAFLGTLINTFYFKIPIGPLIILIASIGFIISITVKLIFQRRPQSEIITPNYSPKK